MHGGAVSNVYLTLLVCKRSIRAKQTAAEIMEKEGGALVDRPRAVAASEIVSKGMRFVLLRSGERLRRFRKAAHTHLQPKAARSYECVQLEIAKDVIMDILNDPKDHQKHVQQ